MAGAAYVPFIGDADIAAELYTDRTVYGADIDPARVAVASARVTGSVVVADCDHWPAQFKGLAEPFAVADFDAYAYPYDAFRAWWEHGAKADRVAVFFTDGQRQAVRRTARWRHPDGSAQGDGDTGNAAGFRPHYNAWWSNDVWPWFTAAVQGWRVVITDKYQRRDMLYWGAVLERGGASPRTDANPNDGSGRRATEKQRAYAAQRLAGKGQAESCRLAGYGDKQTPGQVETACIRLGILPNPDAQTSALRATVRAIEEIREEARRAIVEALDAKRAAIVDALIEAAVSGNVPAIKEGLDRLAGPVKQETAVTGIDGDPLIIAILKMSVDDL